MNDTAQNRSHTASIREVTAAHIAELIRIAGETNLSHWSAASYLDEMKNPSSIMFRLVSETNQTIGFIVGRLINGGETETVVEAEIYNIAVIEAEQRKTHGQHLLDHFLNECRSKHVKNIWLEVRESNSKAIALYERNGFEPVQTRNHFYDNPREHAILMRLKV